MPTRANAEFRVGQFVRLVAPTSSDPLVGRIIAIEDWEDFGGKRRWYYVAWFKGDARSEPEKVAAQEIITEEEL